MAVAAATHPERGCPARKTRPVAQTRPPPRTGRRPRRQHSGGRNRQAGGESARRGSPRLGRTSTPGSGSAP